MSAMPSTPTSTRSTKPVWSGPFPRTGPFGAWGCGLSRLDFGTDRDLLPERVQSLLDRQAHAVTTCRKAYPALAPRSRKPPSRTAAWARATPCGGTVTNVMTSACNHDLRHRSTGREPRHKLGWWITAPSQPKPDARHRHNCGVSRRRPATNATNAELSYTISRPEPGSATSKF